MKRRINVSSDNLPKQEVPTTKSSVSPADQMFTAAISQSQLAKAKGFESFAGQLVHNFSFKAPFISKSSFEPTTDTDKKYFHKFCTTYGRTPSLPELSAFIEAETSVDLDPRKYFIACLKAFRSGSKNPELNRDNFYFSKTSIEDHRNFIQSGGKLRVLCQFSLFNKMKVDPDISAVTIMKAIRAWAMAMSKLPVSLVNYAFDINAEVEPVSEAPVKILPSPGAVSPVKTKWTIDEKNAQFATMLNLYTSGSLSLKQVLEKVSKVSFDTAVGNNIQKLHIPITLNDLAAQTAIDFK